MDKTFNYPQVFIVPEAYLWRKAPKALVSKENKTSVILKLIHSHVDKANEIDLQRTIIKQKRVVNNVSHWTFVYENSILT